MFKVLLCLVLLSLMVAVHTIFFPELVSSNKQPFCPENLSAHGWLLLYYKEGVIIEPVENALRVTVSTTKTRIVLKFCEDKGHLQLPRGDYCVFKGRTDCPQYFETTPITKHQPSNHEKSLNFGDMELCCSSYISDPIAFPLQPPFALVKKGERCESLANTSVSEVSLKLSEQDVSVIDFCYYDTSPCSIDNGGCDQVCYYDSTVVTCSCYHGYSPINDTSCQMDYQYGRAPTLSNLVNRNSSTSQPLLFTTSRDLVVMTISIAVVLMIVFISIILLIRCNRILCLSSCCHTKQGSASIRKLGSNSYSTGERDKPVQRSRVSTQNFNRDSISAPHVGVVAMDLLNRPKTHTSNMHDLPSTSNRASYYENADSVGGSIRTESIYDSLDRRPHNKVAIKTSAQSAQYDEPDKEQSVQPLLLTSSQAGSQYYCEPDQDIDTDVPETPLPAYSPGLNGASGANGSIASEHSPFLFNNSQTYQDPNTKFSHGTLGRKFRAPSMQLQDDVGVTRAASIARIAPIPRVTSHWDQNELLKPVSAGHLCSG